jgi:hypothetical protein
MAGIRMRDFAGDSLLPQSRSRRRTAAVVVLTLAVVSGALASCASKPVRDTSSASCAAVIIYGSHTYWGRGGVLRDPATTGRLVTAVRPPCDDSGGQLPPDPTQRVRVAELADVPLTTGFVFQDTVYLRRSRRLPAATRVWFEPQRCTSAGTFRLTADWLGVTGPKKPRFDGDLRLPYQLEVHVTDGPRRYVGATIHLRADTATHPALGTADVKASLWKGGHVTAAVSCANGRFRALALRSSPGS